MRRVGVRELKAHTSEILRQVREQAEPIAITHRGQVVARLVPAHEPALVEQPVDHEALRTFWESWDALAAKIGEGLPEDVSAVDVVKEGRRELC
jgi:prevent-host-death family protein